MQKKETTKISKWSVLIKKKNNKKQRLNKFHFNFFELWLLFFLKILLYALLLKQCKYLIQNVLNPCSRSSQLYNFYCDFCWSSRVVCLGSTPQQPWYPVRKSLLDLFSILWKVNVDITSVNTIFITIQKENS